MKRKITRFFETLTSIFGINISMEQTASTSILFRKIFLSLFAPWAFLSILVYMIINLRNLEESILAVGCAATNVSIVAGYFYLIYYQKRLRLLFHHIDDHLFTYTDEQRITPAYSWILQERNSLLFFIIVGCYNIFCLILAILAPVANSLINDLRPITIAIYPSWLPTDNSILISSFQVSTVIGASASIYLEWILPIFVCIEFGRQCERLRVALTMLDSRSLADSLDDYISCTTRLNDHPDEPISIGHIYKTNAHFRMKYHQTWRQYLIQCIQHHQQLVKAQTTFKPWFVAAFSTQLLLHCIEIAFMVYSFVRGRDLNQRLISVAAILMCIFSSFAWCCIGDKFSEMHNHIKDSIFYETNWYQQPPQIGQLVRTFHTMVSNKPLTFLAMGYLTITFKMFATLCRYSYNYFNVLLSTT